MFGCKPFNNRQICVKEHINGYEISIAFDDSCNELAENLSRGDIRIYRLSDDKDITEIYTKGKYTTITASIENLTKVYQWVKSH